MKELTAKRQFSYENMASYQRLDLLVLQYKTSRLQSCEKEIFIILNHLVLLQQST